MEFRLLGPLEARERGRLVDLGTPRVRTLLAALLLQANRVVTIDELVDRMWGDDPPGNPRRTVQTNVARLRLALGGADVVQTRERGYLIEIDQWQLDLLRFRALVEQAHPAEDPVRRLRLLDQALALWRGEPLAGLTAESLARDEVPRLAEERLAAQEHLVEVRLALGQHVQLISELTALTARYPLRERLWGHLMLALYRSSRQADALRVYRTLARHLVEELGLDPSDELQRLHRGILAADPALALPAETPVVVRPSWTAQCQLPADVSDFVGRTKILDRIEDLLGIGGMPVVTIAGLPGVGKTALGVRAAHRLRSRFPDGQWFVRLGGATSPRDPADVLAELLRTSGMDGADIPERLDARAAAYRARLADRRVLLVLDDATGADQLEPLMPGTSGCAVLITSRRSLAGLAARYPAHEIPLEVLSPADAQTLLTRILRVGRRRPYTEEVAELAGLCAQLPLALRIAGANLASQPDAAAQRWIAGLRNGNRLGGLSIAGAAVRSAFDQSYASLEPDPRHLFALLGLVPGPDVSAGAAAALLDTTEEVAEDRLDALVAANLIQRHGDRYAFHDLLRLYAAERAAATDDADRAFDRLCSWYLATAEAAARLDGAAPVRLPRPDNQSERFAAPGPARAWLDTERANLVAAAVRAAERGPLAFAWHLPDALAGYFQRGQYLHEWEDAASAGLRAAEAAGYRLAEAAMHRSLGAALERRSGPRTAIRHYEAALARYRQEDAASAQADTLSSLAFCHFIAGDMATARTVIDRGVALVRQLGRTDLLGRALNVMCIVRTHSGALHEALRCATEAIADDRSPRTALLINRGEVQRLLGRYGPAVADATEALAAARHGRVRRHEAQAHDILARIRLDSGHLDLARQHAERTLQLARQLTDAWCEAGALITIGDVYRLRGIPYRATEQYARAVRLAIGGGSPIHEAEARLALAINDLTGGQPSAARNRAHTALDLVRAAGLRIVECQILHLLSVVDAEQGRPEAAAARAAQAREIEAETGYRPPPHLPVLPAGLAANRSAGLTGSPAERQAAISVP
jgi:DNA-binding SARP family transcriptional activator/tetratricopeptide (TPR) repeat protein